MASFPWAGTFEGLSLEELLLLFMDPNEHHSEQPGKQRGEAWRTQTSPSEQSMSTLPEDRIHAFVKNEGSSWLPRSLRLITVIGKDSLQTVFLPRMWKSLN